MAASSGSAVSSGNDDQNNFWSKFGSVVLSGVSKKIDQEIASDSNNMPDQNDLVFGFGKRSSKNAIGSSIDPRLFIVGGVALILVVVFVKKVL